MALRPVLLLPVLERRFADTQLAAHLFDLRAQLRLLERERDLRLGELARLRGMSSVSNRENHAGFSTSQRCCFLV